MTANYRPIRPRQPSSRRTRSRGTTITGRLAFWDYRGGPAPKQHRLNTRESSRTDHDRLRAELIGDIADHTPGLAFGDPALRPEARHPRDLHPVIHGLAGDVPRDLIEA